MDRLKVLLLPVILLASTQVSRAYQDTHQQHAMTADGSFVVVGDVSNFNYFSLPAGTPITIKDAVLRAGVASDTVTVSVFRGTLERPCWTQLVSQATPDSGETVEAEDVLVVRAMSQPGIIPVANAAIRSSTGTIVVALADDSVAVGDILQQTGQAIRPGDRAFFSYRHPGSPLFEHADLSCKVSHGDVISLQRKRVQNIPTRQIGNMVPAFSEWKDNPVSPPEDRGEPSLLPIPQASSNSPGSELLSHDEWAPTEGQPQSPGTFDSPETNPSTPQIDQLPPVLPESEVSQSHSHSLRMVSQSSELPTGALPDAAPMPPSEEPLLPDANSAGGHTKPDNYWSLAFIGVFVLASSLIIFGATRVEAERGRVLMVEAETEQGRVAADAAIQPSVVPSESPIDVHETVVAIDRFASLRKTKHGQNITGHSSILAQPSDIGISERNLIATHEWFGDDWMNRSAVEVNPATGISETVPSESELSDAVNSESGKRPASYLLEELVMNSLSESQTIVNSQLKRPDEKGVAATAVPAEPKRLEDCEEPTEPESVDSEVLRQLELLLQNRLPVDLCTTDLPLRISLFGKPAGPHRFRLDAAHTKVPAPHIRTRTRVTKAPGVEAAAAVHTATQNPTGGSQSLDQALNILQDRNDV